MTVKLLSLRRRTGLAIAAAALLIGLTLVLDWRWSRSPALYLAASQGGELPAVAGFVTVDTLIDTIGWMLDKPGGYLSNDIFPPSRWLDNMPHFEFGVLVQTRDLARSMRNDYSRSRGQPAANAELAIAETALNAPYDSWILPSTESRLRDAREALIAYRSELVSLGERDAQFVANAASLREWLAVVERRLGDLSQNLAASVGPEPDASDSAAPPETGTVPRPAASAPKTPRLAIDDVFFQARGSAWALLQFLAAAEIDFEPALTERNALASLRRIRSELEGALQPLASPLILNGEGFGLFANHSLVLASYLSRAHAGVIELRELLALP